MRSVLIVWVRSMHATPRGIPYSSSTPTGAREDKKVLTVPSEQYCEFGGTVKKCEEWLEKNHPDLHEKLYSEGGLLLSSYPGAFFDVSLDQTP